MHKTRLALLPIIFSLFACSHEKPPVTSPVFIDSMINHYQEPVFARTNDSDIQFWRNRINPLLPGIASESKYAGTLSMRFHLFGDIQDIQTADSVMLKLDSD